MPLQTHKPFSIAPMMGWTDRWFRTLMRIMAPQAMLYTEMITANAVIHADHLRVFEFSDFEQPLGIQLGGGDPESLARACKRLRPYGFQEFNLNAGCPSVRVQNANIGACLMLDPIRLTECYQALLENTDVPATLKCRLGVDTYQDYSFIANHVEKLQNVGCRKIIIHARSAWLKGLNPKQNRTIPPLDYPKVHQLKKDFPDMWIEINGGIRTLEDYNQHKKHVDAVMFGRVCYENPYFIAELAGHDSSVTAISRSEVINQYVTQLGNVPVYNWHRAIQGLFNLYKHQSNAKRWKKALMAVSPQKTIANLMHDIYQSDPSLFST